MAKRGGKRVTSFKPGQSGNPSGRPKIIAEVRDLAREYTVQAINTLAEVMGDTKAPAAARVTAASVIIDRGYGRAPQHITAEIALFEKLTIDERYALDEAIAAVALNAGSDQSGEPQTHH